MCGNSFHPSLISSAFGSDDVLKRWIQGEEGGPTTFVADQSRVHALYAELAQLIKQKGRELHKNTDIPVVEELPRYPSVESVSGQVPLPSIAQPVLPVKLSIELSKNDQRIESGIDATVAHVNEDACWTLERASLALYFDAFRAPVTFGFDADTLLRLLWSESQLQKTQSVFREHCPQCPVATDIANIRLSSLLQSIAATAKTKWPVGYILLVGSGRSYNVFYLGNPNPKLLILADYRHPRKPLLTLMGATAYSEPLSIGCAPTILPTTRLLEQHNGDDFLYVECASGQWFLHYGPCQCTWSWSSCLCCLLSMLGDIRECPWHCSMSETTLHDYTVAHLIGVDGGNGKANVIGYIGSLPLHTHLILIHIVPEAKLAECHARIAHLCAPFLIFYHLPSGVLPQSSLESLSSPFRKAQLPLWLFQHFLVRTAGPKALLDSWLLPRSLTLGSCDVGVSRSIKKVFQLLLKDAFATRFGYSGPRHTIFIRDLAFLPHVIQTDLPWRRIRLELVRTFLDIDCRKWGHCLVAPHSLDRSSARLVEIGNALLNYRISIQQTVPTRMRVLYSWNLDSWHAPKQPKRDLRMRKCKALLAKGPICLQETKWSASEKEVLMQHIPGLQIAESLATPTPSGHWSGGVAVLVPPGYVLKESQDLVKGRAVAALIADRTSQYYIVSVYLHPDKVRQDLAALLRALEGLNRSDTRIILTGDFNRADERCAGEWNSFLEALHVFDVFPSLGTYRHPRGLSPLDRCLVPNDVG